MENASKAVIIAGGLLITLIILSLLVIVFSQIGGIYSERERALSLEQIEEYNRQFTAYEKSLYGSELLSLANLIDDYNYRLLYSEGIYDENGKYNPEGGSGEFYEENKFDVKVIISEGTVGYEGENISYNGLKPTNGKGKDISYIKEYNDKLEEMLKNMEKANVDKKSEDYQNVKSSITELRSMPFECTHISYNKYGRISTMTFKQIWDKDIYDTIHR